MASKKLRDIVVKVGEYTDRNTGETKGRFENVGALMQSDKDDSMFIMLKRTFNPAGVPGQDARESLLLSCYVPKDPNAASNSGGASDDKKGASPSAGAGSAGLDDEIPF